MSRTVAPVPTEEIKESVGIGFIKVYIKKPIKVKIKKNKGHFIVSFNFPLKIYIFFFLIYNLL